MSDVVQFPQRNNTSSFISENNTWLCVSCRKDTGVSVHTPVDACPYPTDAGELCGACSAAIYGTRFSYS